ncbi:Thiol-disulfide oxidoreductase LTO1 [Porphyridium purpureum]|uniref:Thiol-disulfide oxidoreductase LTO1 n=1 Tax=Porphyridium purpureum TaxID=35688 RepID=A0A5J4YSL9_PORPP|nr:Thiol-disulfide oxidoreductase LTO1 [Porphyridium purpureum]|eukprot:POR3355..scf236_6
MFSLAWSNALRATSVRAYFVLPVAVCAGLCSSIQPRPSPERLDAHQSGYPKLNPNSGAQTLVEHGTCTRSSGSQNTARMPYDRAGIHTHARTHMQVYARAKAAPPKPAAAFLSSAACGTPVSLRSQTSFRVCATCDAARHRAAEDGRRVKRPTGRSASASRVPRSLTTSMMARRNQEDETSDQRTMPVESAGAARKLLGIFGLAGVVETSFLSVKELLDPIASFCPTEGCRTVLNSAYSDISGIPLALFGLSSFLVFTFVALYPYLLPADREDSMLRDMETRQAVLVLSSGMAAISLYNVGIMAFELHAFCQYCVVSALLTFALCIGSIFLTKLDEEASLMPGAYSFLGASVLALFLFITADLDTMDNEAMISARPPGAAAQSEGFEPPQISTTSTDFALRLAKQLESQDAKMFGAYWCSHCYSQKQALGKEAFAYIKYIECDKKGFNSQNKLCQEKKVPGYPTWEISGELFPGELELEELADISNLEKELAGID